MEQPHFASRHVKPNSSSTRAPRRTSILSCDPSTGRPTESSRLKAGLFSYLTPDDLRYRFLSPLKRVGPDVLAMMTHVDHKQSEDFLAFDNANGRLIENAMLAASPGGEQAEVALAVDCDYKQKGVSWTLLQHVMHVAKAKGIKKLHSIEDRGHKDAIALEREIGFKAKSYPGDATLMLLEADLQEQ